MSRNASTALIVVGIVLLLGGIVDLVTDGPNKADLGYGALVFGAVFAILGTFRRRH
ncbi:hypothetical protein [Curtobacterium sp. MCBD17_040]|uniref:hypothetical protein n=1 Tax=Curtobacterium sp. MCBD17_040 TaxID=2175674 RepID=UPI0015E87A79|nr:hypothetical protein [Curtobacterium sp. MCBD17_040]WIB65747.1 hypothetical protein DEI94_16645 [Curtobacterium sp. MCBD17_040]